MSHTGIPPLDQSETKVVFGELLASGEANFLTLDSTRLVIGMA